MKEVKNDIVVKDDVRRLVDAFYEKVKSDPSIGHKFSNVDWPRHLPVMYDFWSSMLLGDQSYRGNPFQKHTHLNLTSLHFDSWLALFHQTVDEMFAGQNAEEIKQRAQNIAEVWQHKMKLKYS
jgi:hemoglobin